MTRVGPFPVGLPISIPRALGCGAPLDMGYWIWTLSEHSNRVTSFVICGAPLDVRRGGCNAGLASIEIERNSGAPPNVVVYIVVGTLFCMNISLQSLHRFTPNAH